MPPFNVRVAYWCDWMNRVQSAFIQSATDDQVIPQLNALVTNAQYQRQR